MKIKEIFEKKDNLNEFIGTALTVYTLSSIIGGGWLTAFLMRRTGLTRTGLISDFLKELKQSKAISLLNDNKRGTAAFNHNGRRITVKYDIQTNRYEVSAASSSARIESGRVLDIDNKTLLAKLAADIDNVSSKAPTEDEMRDKDKERRQMQQAFFPSGVY